MNFIELLRISIGTLHDIPLDKDTDWDLMFEMAEKQSLTGVISKRIERLPKEMQPKKLLKKDSPLRLSFLLKRKEDQMIYGNVNSEFDVPM